MRIALVAPTYWPEVRRGSERLVHDLGVELVGHGHDVTVITSHRAAPGTRVEDGIRVIRSWRPPEVTPLNWYEHHVSNVPNVIRELLRGRYDLAHAFFVTDAWGALAARDRGGPPVAFSFHGIPNRPFLVKRRYRLEMMSSVVSRAAAVSVLSAAAAQPMRRYFALDPVVLPGGVRCSDFVVDVERSPHPTLVCAASLGDPRKRAELLLSAFSRLRAWRPETRLLLVRTPDPVMSGTVPTLPEGAAWIDGDDTEQLAAAYAAAWASVLPSVEEAFGLVLIESLATGTPVVAARSGACPEIVAEDAHGVIFEPDDEESLSRAMDEILQRPVTPEVAATCRARAADYDWATVVGSYEAAYDDVVGSDGLGSV